MKAHQIELQSFAIIEQELGARCLPEAEAPIIKRVIHTTADFEYAETLVFQREAVAAGLAALRAGATIVTDTNMVLAGINKQALEQLGCRAVCYMADPAVAEAARRDGTTRAVASMERAAALSGPLIYAIGNAPTALLHVCQQLAAGQIAPALVIGVPVGFVNVVESKEQLLQQPIPAIVARGRKGGSNVAAAIVNALLYRLTREEV